MNSPKELKKQNLLENQKNLLNHRPRRKENTRSGKINYAIYYNPTLIPALLKDVSISKGMIYSLLEKVIPCRVGIEFEYVGNFGKWFIGKYFPGEVRSGSSRCGKLVSKFYKFNDFNQDSLYYNYVKPTSEGICDPDSVPLVQNDSLEEMRVQLNGFRSLSGLYRFLYDCKESCAIPEFGGIHFHIDLSEYIVSSASDPNTIKCLKWLQNHLSSIIDIFPKYTGKYNKRGVKINTKGYYVNLSRLHTMEVRIAPLTFEYSDIISWISKLIMIRRKMIHDLHLRKSNIENTNKSKISEACNSEESLTSFSYRDISEAATTVSNYIINNSSSGLFTITG